MCGIVGVYKYNGIDERLNNEVGKGAEYIRHRGPDYIGTWNDVNFSIAHDKLSILDFSSMSNQPVVFDSVVVAFNGEIYNYKHLIEEYSLPDCVIDAHVIARLYERMGMGFLKKIEGDFAIALYDRIEEKLYICRDRMGVKPVVYTCGDDGEIFFSSEVKAFKAFSNIELKVNKNRIANDLLFWFWADKKETYFENVYYVLPGMYLCMDKGKITEHRYWDISHIICNVDDNKIDNILKEATIRRLQGSAKYATLLSGGLDSSILTGIIASEVGKVTSYTIAYDETENNIDLEYAKSVVAMYGNIKHVINNVPKELISYDFVVKLTYHLEEVVWDKVYGSMYINYNRAINDGFRIVINGQGADECLVGYYHDFDHYTFSKSKLVNLDYMFDYFLKNNIKDLSILNNENIDEWKIMLSNTLNKNLPSDLNSWNSKDIVAFWAMKTYLHSNLVQEDRMSMANSCECRVPFTDYRFVELMFSMDGDLKVVQGNEKIPLKRIARKYLPVEITKRQKQAFVNPKNCYNEIAYNYIRNHSDEISNSEVFRYIFNSKFLDNIKKCDFSFNQELAWKIMAIDIFIHTFFVAD